jgi:hypothetical protein
LGVQRRFALVQFSLPGTEMGGNLLRLELQLFAGRFVDDCRRRR